MAQTLSKRLIQQEYQACTKHNYLVKKSDELSDVMHEAFYVAANGRPGPVVVDLPKDILFADAPYFAPKDVRPCAYQPKTNGDLTKIEQAQNCLLKLNVQLSTGAVA